MHIITFLIKVINMFLRIYYVVKFINKVNGYVKNLKHYKNNKYYNICYKNYHYILSVF